jgi:hypothetical protein
MPLDSDEHIAVAQILIVLGADPFFFLTQKDGLPRPPRRATLRA